jgi:ankyrin repeat protein
LLLNQLSSVHSNIDVVDKKRNETPLHWAARTNNKKLVDLLLMAGADVTISGRSI